MVMGLFRMRKKVNKILQHRQRSQNLQHLSPRDLCDTTSAVPQYSTGFQRMFCWQMHSTRLSSLCEIYSYTNTSGYFNIFSGCSGCIKTGPQFEGQSQHRWVLEVYELGRVCCYCGYNYRYAFLSYHTNTYFFCWKYTILMFFSRHWKECFCLSSESL